jgi:hypothetical protein
MGTGFAGVGTDDVRLAGKILGDFFDQANFIAGGAVKVAAQDRKSLHDDRVGVAFDSIKWFHAGKMFATLMHLRNNNSEINHMRGFFQRHGVGIRVEIRSTRQEKMRRLGCSGQAILEATASDFFQALSNRATA